MFLAKLSLALPKLNSETQWLVLLQSVPFLEGLSTKLLLTTVTKCPQSWTMQGHHRLTETKCLQLRMHACCLLSSPGKLPRVVFPRKTPERLYRHLRTTKRVPEQSKHPTNFLNRVNPNYHKTFFKDSQPKQF